MKLAQPIWLDKNVPFAEHYQDIYYNPAAGLMESEHVFIGGNRIIERLNDTKTLVIGETGFGTGLNALTLAYMLEKHAIANVHLQFFSLENCPISKQDMHRAHLAFPSLWTVSEQMIANYNPPTITQARLRINTNIIDMYWQWADVNKALQAFPVVDAWFLDGFNPKTNPEMWSMDVCHALAAHSHPQTTLATYTVAGMVRRNLIQAGFSVQKIKGFGRKREMLVGKKSYKTECS
jgi:tRNA 5-methylaminomethyl-2-thiouridine biosynthesis bifunctional protein